MNPGPQLWRISSCNPTGLSGKAAEFSSLGPGIVAVSETHLTTQGIIRFNKELKGTKSPFALLHGPPVPYRSNATTSCGGKQTGVGFLSTCPARPINKGWSDEVVESCRVVGGHFFVHNVWLQGAVAYGFAHQSESLKTKAMTEELLQAITQQVVPNKHKFAFIAGDWNQHYESLQEVKLWESWVGKKFNASHMRGGRWNQAPLANAPVVKTFYFFLLLCNSWFRVFVMIGHLFPIIQFCLPFWPFLLLMFQRHDG